MTLAEIIALARSVWHNRLDDEADNARLALAILDLLAEDAPCGFESPVIGGFDENEVRVPDSWAAWVTPDDARALARMLLRAADEADAKGRP